MFIHQWQSSILGRTQGRLHSRNNSTNRYRQRRRFNFNTSENGMDKNTSIQNIGNQPQFNNNRAYPYSANSYSQRADSSSQSQASPTYSQSSEEAYSEANVKSESNRKMDEVQCYRCQAFGHYALQCPTRLQSRQSTHRNPVNHTRLKPQLPTQANQSNPSRSFRTRYFTRSASMHTNHRHPRHTNHS
jgi:hypothetical protein